MPKFVDNLYIVDNVLGIEVGRLISEEITLDEFTNEFSEDKELPKKLIDARKTLGVGVEETDFVLISKNYKELARKHHPDMPGGNHKQFQEINAAHKLIKKELT
ncbi:hypothetical protein COU61_00675 [Candidatus Pacearchaeota archaeon CG10_big_fil_rev_8_21_14_0_10_35_13]|nr:MAG: hypothetical protein COU61_00675 [Candidatus Pacearchaeota archaeon CG10_big_fil_rev_8_21_14_0_10_35_13]